MALCSACGVYEKGPFICMDQIRLSQVTSISARRGTTGSSMNDQCNNRIKTFAGWPCELDLILPARIQSSPSHREKAPEVPQMEVERLTRVIARRSSILSWSLRLLEKAWKDHRIRLTGRSIVIRPSCLCIWITIKLKVERCGLDPRHAW